MMSCGSEINSQGKAFLTPPVSWRSQRSVPVMPCSERKPRRSPQARVDDLFHVIHKVPAGDSPYVRAKHVQLIDKDPSKAISLFWSAINSGDRVDSALKDMAVVMKQLDRSDEAIEAIKSFRHLCAPESQESLDNVLVELYKKSNRIEEEIEVLLLKLKHIEDGIAFGGKQTKLARSQGKKVNITIEKEYSRLLGNLAWAYVQQRDYKSAEEFYRKALSLEPDKNKQCNLAICLMHMNKVTEARFLLRSIRLSANNRPMDESYAKSYERAVQMMDELESGAAPSNPFGKEVQTPVTNWNRGGISQQNTSFCRRDENWRSLPFNGGGIPRVPYTQPRRREERATIDCSRKLLFEQPRGGPLNNGINMRNEHANGRLKEIAENTMENLKQVQGNDTNRKSILNFTSFKSKKSWADMVDEEEQAQEQKLLNEIHNYGADDENTNYNITPNQPLSDLEGGLYTQPGNHNVRRSLCFDKKGDALNFDSNDSMLTEGCNSSSNDMNLLNRNRLQVFCDITPNNSRLVS